MDVQTRLTPAARKAISRAVYHARKMSEARITVSHVVLAIAETDSNHAARILAKLGITPAKIHSTFVPQMIPSPGYRPIRMSEVMGAALYRAERTANELGHENIGLQHILLGIAAITNDENTRKFFLKLGVSAIKVRSALREAILEDDVQLGDPEASIMHRPADAPIILDPVVADDPVPA